MRGNREKVVREISERKQREKVRESGEIKYKEIVR